MPLNRRQVLRVIGRTARLTGVGGLLVALAKFLPWGHGQRHTARPRVGERSEHTFRPPGALPEPDFLARCIHCYVCQDVCPAGCIQMKADGEAYRHTPFILPREKGCTLCLKCGDACPTGALRPLTHKAEVRMGVAIVDETLCLSHLRTGVCGACFTACPLRGQAIKQGLYNAPRVYPDHCTGCGLCEEVCIVSYRAIRVVPLAGVRQEIPS